MWIGFSEEASTSSLLRRSKTEARFLATDKRSKAEVHDAAAPNRLSIEGLGGRS